MDAFVFLSGIAVALLVFGLVWLFRGSGGGVGAREMDARLERIVETAARTERLLREEGEATRKEAERRSQALREEVGRNIMQFGTSVDQKIEGFSRTHAEFADRLREEVRNTIASFGDGLKNDVKLLVDASNTNQEALRQTVSERLDKMRGENEAKLEAVRVTVEEKLQGTLDKRLGESFAQVSDRLEQVHRGLGEMQTLAVGVGDLKRVMSNVKDRGGWAEVQLGAMLEQMLARDQYETNARMEAGASEVVEYAVRMPGQGDGERLLLPIDAKFPKEAYERLVEAWEEGSAEKARAATQELENVIETEAKRISSKYIRPPATTDFAVMYLPTEGLFAETLRITGLVQRLQSRHRVTVAGPTTLHALLNSLQMGFRTLAIQKRSSEVWRVLGEAKVEFQKYVGLWDKLERQLSAAQKTVEEAGTRTRAVERKLKDVETVDLPSNAQAALEIVSPDDSDYDPAPVKLVASSDQPALQSMLGGRSG